MLSLTPLDSVTAGPLRIENALLDGFTLLCVRSTAKKFAPFRQEVSRVVLTAKAGGVFRNVLQISSDLLKDDRPDVDPEDAEAVRARKREDWAREEEQGKKILAIPEEDFEQMERLNASMAELQEAAPKDPKRVAALVLGWEGVDQGGAPVPFSRDAILSLLSDKAVGDSKCFVTNGDGKTPLVMDSGDWAGFTFGEAFCRLIPEAIREATAAEQVEVEEKKDSSAPPPSSGDGSGTEKRVSESRLIVDGGTS